MAMGTGKEPCVVGTARCLCGGDVQVWMNHTPKIFFIPDQIDYASCAACGLLYDHCQVIKRGDYKHQVTP